VTASRCVDESRNAGFDNISIDLIYAIPGLTEHAWLDNINRALQLNPDHISAYSLTIEPKTVFGNWSAKGKIISTPDDVSAAHLEMLVNLLQRAGYDQYEVSNFAKPGFQSQHNSSYWKRESYLGIGPSAHSYNGSSRQYNVKNNNLYIKAIESGTIPFEKETLSREDHINEYLLTTLRTSWGTDLQILQHDFNYDLLQNHQGYVDQLIQQKLAELQNHKLFLTPAGKMMADKITSDLFIIS
jgi:oxygen-independent coproporphyrinogen-3 oxidase